MIKLTLLVASAPTPVAHGPLPVAVPTAIHAPPHPVPAAFPAYAAGIRPLLAAPLMTAPAPIAVAPPPAPVPALAPM